ncbi:MAG: 3-phosphoshikimate 1-carboxyvinyltransferase [Oscillospiraceae bacterium]|nr:3-phosphoshikimate 1-carboxyvinyltransferase [Oscillospiraceae bacterium]
MQDLKNIKLNPGFKSGTVAVPSSKSISHRAIICAGLAENGESHINNIDMSEDVQATTDAMRVFKNYKNAENIIIHCKESGSLLRFLIPVAAALGINATFTGEGTLLGRPISLYQDLFADKGVSIQSTLLTVPVIIRGKLSAGKFYVPGNITSQYITGLLFALPLLDGDSEIILTSPLESEPYVDITVDVLKVFGITVDKTKDGYSVKGNQAYKSADYVVEGDYSQAAFFASAAAINGDIAIKNLNPKSHQGDYKIIDILRDFGAKVYFDGDVLRASKGENLRGIKLNMPKNRQTSLSDFSSKFSIDASQIPDLVPVLSVVAAYADGETVIYNARRLRIKESDRIRAVYDMLTAIGSNVREADDGLIIRGTGGKKLPGGVVKSVNDHRIAMSAAVASINTENGVIIDDMTCINKSYPMFLRDLLALDIL